jgi:hypothetical protein
LSEVEIQKAPLYKGGWGINKENFERSRNPKSPLNKGGLGGLKKKTLSEWFTPDY